MWGFVALAIAWCGLVMAIAGLVGQRRACGRVSPERRAALRAAWADIQKIEHQTGMTPTKVPWWIGPGPPVEEMLEVMVGPGPLMGDRVILTPAEREAMVRSLRIRGESVTHGSALDGVRVQSMDDVRSRRTR